MAGPDRVRLALDHIADALDDLEALTAGVEPAAFLADRLKQRAVERCLEEISEASRRLPEELKAAHPDIRGGRSPASGMCCGTTTTTSILS